MLSKIYNFWELLRNNLWFTPTLFCLMSLCATLGLYFIEINYLNKIDLPFFFFKGSINDAKDITTTLLSAMITMATLAISITIVVLSLAASQLGPRLIQSFMSDRSTKNYIGIFFAVVISCFTLTILLHNLPADYNSPDITISFVFCLCFVNMFTLLGFVNHVAHSCIADNIILQVNDDLSMAIKRLTVTKENNSDQKEYTYHTWPSNFEAAATSLTLDQSGYVQFIDYNKILKLLCAYDAYISIPFSAGYFYVGGEKSIKIKFPSKSTQNEKTTEQAAYDLNKKISDCFIIGKCRTSTQDIDYSIRHLVEIAIRALSPGINDSFTALHVIDHLSSCLALLLDREIPELALFDENNIQRIKARQNNDAEIIFLAFEQIRQSGVDMPVIARHFIKRLGPLSDIARTDSARQALSEQIKGIKNDLGHMKRYIPDQDSILKDAEYLLRKLENQS